MSITITQLSEWKKTARELDDYDWYVNRKAYFDNKELLISRGAENGVYANIKLSGTILIGTFTTDKDAEFIYDEDCTQLAADMSCDNQDEAVTAFVNLIGDSSLEMKIRDLIKAYKICNKE